MKFASQPDPTRLASFDFKGLRIYTDLFNSCIILGLIVHIILILNVYWQRELIICAHETFTQHDSLYARTHAHTYTHRPSQRSDDSLKIVFSTIENWRLYLFLFVYHHIIRYSCVYLSCCRLNET